MLSNMTEQDKVKEGGNVASRKDRRQRSADWLVS